MRMSIPTPTNSRIVHWSCERAPRSGVVHPRGQASHWAWIGAFRKLPRWHNEQVPLTSNSVPLSTQKPVISITHARNLFQVAQFSPKYSQKTPYSSHLYLGTWSDLYPVLLIIKLNVIFCHDKLFQMWFHYCIVHFQSSTQRNDVAGQFVCVGWVWVVMFHCMHMAHVLYSFKLIYTVKTSLGKWFLLTIPCSNLVSIVQASLKNFVTKNNIVNFYIFWFPFGQLSLRQWGQFRHNSMYISVYNICLLISQTTTTQ